MILFSCWKELEPFYNRWAGVNSNIHFIQIYSWIKKAEWAGKNHILLRDHKKTPKIFGICISKCHTWNYRYDYGCLCENECLGREENGEGEKKEEEEIISDISVFLVSSHLQDYLWINLMVRSEEQATSLKVTLKNTSCICIGHSLKIIKMYLSEY